MIHDAWFEEHEQAFQDDWALRLLRCPRPRCRRALRCPLAAHACPALQCWPMPEAIHELRRRIVRYAIDKRYRAMQAGPEAVAAHKAASQRQAARMRKLAFARARETLGWRKKGTRGGASG